MSPLQPSSHPLLTTLQGQAREFMDQCDLQCDWSMDIAPGLPAPQGPMAEAVSQIFDEMLSNVVRHAEASRVEIRVCAHASDLTVVVKDNGRGAPPSAFDNHRALGVMSMRTRASDFGGWLYIDSQMGLGTTVIMTMPMYRTRSASSAA